MPVANTSLPSLESDNPSGGQAFSSGGQALGIRPIRLDFLDGLRGLAALYVVFAHLYMTVFSFQHGPLPRWLTLLISWMSIGRLAVDIFIVLSGYCLMLPVVRSAHGRLSGGLPQFFLRRARRILPPYYAALAVALLASALAPGIYPMIGVDWKSGPTVLASEAFGSHLLLIHNLSPRWIGAIDYPMWSVATEWQIYFFFALLLLPLWRRFGMAATLIASLVLGIALDRQFPAAYFHFLALFAMGMAGAVISVSPDEKWQRWREKLPWGLLAGALTTPLFLFLVWKHTMRGQFALPVDLIVGVITVFCLIACAQNLADPQLRPKMLLLRLFESRWAVTLGVFSYSLYLIHAIVLALVFQALRPCPFSATRTCLLYFGLGLPLSVLAAYGFHLLFERPFLRRRRNETAAELARDAALSPAP